MLPLQCGGIKLVVLGNINTFQLPPNFTSENHQVLSGGFFGFLFAPLLLFYYFLLLIINRLGQGCPSLGLNDISPVLSGKNGPWIISWNFQKALRLSLSTRGRNFYMSNIKLQQTQCAHRLAQDKMHLRFLQDTERTRTPMKNHATHSVFANCHILPFCSCYIPSLKFFDWRGCLNC